MEIKLNREYYRVGNPVKISWNIFHERINIAIVSNDIYSFHFKPMALLTIAFGRVKTKFRL